LLFTTDRDDVPSFYRKDADGARDDELVVKLDVEEITEAFPTDWSADGERVLFHAARRGGVVLTADLWMLSMTGTPTPSPLIRTDFTDWVGSFSPDGRWLAFVSNESGPEEVYVRLLEGTTRVRVSVGGGTQPRWRRDGREIFYVAPDNRLMTAALTYEPELAVSPPRPLYAACGARPPSWEYHYDVVPDGSRMLWACSTRGAETTATVVLNSVALRAQRR
jgi:hypothetical protein